MSRYPRTVTDDEHLDFIEKVEELKAHGLSYAKQSKLIGYRNNTSLNPIRRMRDRPSHEKYEKLCMLHAAQTRMNGKAPAPTRSPVAAKLAEKVSAIDSLIVDFDDLSNVAHPLMRRGLGEVVDTLRHARELCGA